MARSSKNPGRILLLTGLGSLAFGLAVAGTGGPDGGGWEYIDSDETSGPPHRTLDIDDEGEDLGLADEDTAVVDLPFDVEFYGRDMDQITVGDNGTAFFAGAQAASSASCPGAGGSWSGVAAYWDDLQGGTVRSATLGRWPYRMFVLDWQGFTPAGASGTGQVQVWWQEGRSAEVVIVQEDISFSSSSHDGGVGAIIGTQGGSVGLEWACSGGLSDQTSAWFGEPTDRPAAAEIDLSTADLEWYGPSNYSYLGEVLASGDLNADGYPDLVMGAPETTTVYLSYGGASPLDGDASTAQATFSGDSGNQLGAALAVADLDGDGMPELALGEPQYDSSSVSNLGAVHILQGGSLAGSHTLPDDADLTLTPTESTDKPQFGTALTTGDLDGDGYADLVVGAPNRSVSGSANVGTAYVYLGAATGVSSAAWTVTGKSAGEKLGKVLAAGDADGDGVDDLLLGSPDSDDGGTDAGQVWLVLGSSSAGGTVTVNSAATASFTGSSALDLFGSALALADLDDDGLGDLVVGAPDEGTGGSGAGAAYVFLDGSSWVSTYSASDADWVSLGGSTNEALGSSLSAVDLNVDGVNDLIIGAPGANGSSGAVAVFHGPITAASVTSADAQHLLEGAVAAGAAGTAVVGLEDHDGDGFGEVAVGSWFAASGSTTLAGLVQVWDYVSAFQDEDGDGLLSHAAGGPDCDDGDSGIFPGADEDTGLDSGIADDRDCDGWVDGGFWLRTRASWFEEDLADLLNTSGGGEAFDFEDASLGDDLSSHYSANGLEFYASTFTASDEAFGAAASGSVAGKVSGSSLTLTFDTDVDALAFQILDASGPFQLQAWDSDGSTLLSSGGVASLEAEGEDVPGGRFVGVVFGASVSKVRITPSTSDGIGVDDLVVHWASESDRDADGYTGDDGDCDDFDADVNPAATEVLGDSIDNDCDGTVDGGGSTAYTDLSSWSADAGITVQTVDFEDLSVGDTVSTDYADLGLTVDSSLLVASSVDGAAPNDSQGAQALSTTVTLSFEEVQPAVAFQVLDGKGSFTLTGSVGGSTLYTDTLTLSEEGRSSFHGYVYDYGVDTLEISGPSGDTWGLDDIAFSELGLDDADGDGLTEADGDCDDSDATTYPGATETWYDGVDSDCGGDSDYDADGDGYDTGDDCDDTDSSVSPDATEVWYDGVDSDCDGASDYDTDLDGYDDAAYGGTDCDDSSDAVSPGATETYYDSTDDNCDPTDDYDADGDGYSASGYAASGSLGSGDCDDSDASASPGGTETWYDGVDSDCDGGSDYDADADGYESDSYGGDDCDDGDDSVNPGATDTWYDGLDQDCAEDSDYDADGDGYDLDLYGGLDCDDTDASINPDATESDGDDGIDEDCDGTDEWDDDGDGYRDEALGGTDCDDTDATINPGATDTCYDGIDADCGGDSDYDCDSDGYDSDGYGGADCDDSNGSVNPGATEYVYDGVDSDCDGSDDYDADGDGYQTTLYGGLDCDDSDAAINPGATEVWYDGVDSDCGTDSDYDADGDGADAAAYGGDDCDDTDATICPSCVDTPDDGIDQDCDGADDPDGDGDGYGSDDCDDTDSSIHPGAEEIWYDGVDQDCDESSDFDADLDGQDAEAYGGQDCDDSDPATYFGASERWYDGRDGDCLGGDDFDQDGDGYRIDTWGGTDCVDTDAAIHPGVTEDSCYGGDEDCDGQTDEDCPTQDTGDPSDTSDTADTSEDTGPDTDTPQDSEPDTGDSGTPQDSQGPAPQDSGGQESGCGGCAASQIPGSAAWLLIPFGLLLWRRRRV